MTSHPWLSCLLLAGTICFAGTEPMAACTNKIVSETFSPNSLLKAVVFIRDCGQGVRNAHLSVLPTPRALPDARGNTFIGEGGVSSADEKDRLRIAITWLSDTELSVLHGVVRRVRYENSVRGVKIYYGHLVDLPPPSQPE